jgi:transcriptional regulator with XRE-family HTH domain
MSGAELCRATRGPDNKALSQPGLWAIESGKTKKLKADTLFRIAAALNANPEWIRSGTGNPFDSKVATSTASELLGLYAALSPEKQQMILAAVKAIS